MVAKMFLVALGFAHFFVARQLMDEITLIKSGSQAQKLPRGLKFEIFSVTEKELTIFFQRLLSLSHFTDSESRAGKDKELCSRSASSKAESKLSFHESLHSFLPLASIAAPFSITFLFHYSISQTCRL